MTSFLFWLAVAANVVTLGTAIYLLCRWIKRQQRKRQRRRSKVVESLGRSCRGLYIFGRDTFIIEGFAEIVNIAAQGQANEKRGH